MLLAPATGSSSESSATSSPNDFYEGTGFGSMSGQDYAVIFVLDVVATVLAIFLYVAIGGSF